MVLPVANCGFAEDDSDFLVYFPIIHNRKYFVLGGVP